MGNIISAEKRCNYPGRSGVKWLVGYRHKEYRDSIFRTDHCGECVSFLHIMFMHAILLSFDYVNL